MFHATVALRSVLQIQPGLLRQYGIRGLMLDLDNTLTTHDNPAPAEGVLSWIGVMRQAGIAMMIVSNNRPHRVQPFAAALGLPFVAEGAKPLPRGFRQAHTPARHMDVRRNACSCLFPNWQWLAIRSLRTFWAQTCAGSSPFMCAPFSMKTRAFCG